jgi:hypothetical protein
MSTLNVKGPTKEQSLITVSSTQEAMRLFRPLLQLLTPDSQPTPTQQSCSHKGRLLGGKIRRTIIWRVPTELIHRMAVRLGRFLLSKSKRVRLPRIIRQEVAHPDLHSVPKA